MEFNKKAAAFLIAGIIALLSGIIADGLYDPKLVVDGNKPDIIANASESSTLSTGAATVVAEKLDIKALMAKADVEAGKSIAKKCTICHSFDKGGANKVGPNLWNVVGGKIGHKADFNYSKGLLDKGGNWDFEGLAHFLHSPKDYIKGTKMAFAGLKKPEDIANILEYLRQSADNPKPKP